MRYLRRSFEFVAVVSMMYWLYWVITGFIGLAPGDFPWEDVFPPVISHGMYLGSSLFEWVRDLILS